MRKKTKLIFIYLGIIILFLFLNTFAVSFVKISGTSMLPTLEDGDYVLVLKAQDVKGGDVVLVQLSNGQYITKRVVGIEGDDILIKAHELYVNGILFDNLTNSLQGDYQENIHVPSQSFYILGDNRLESFDSRSIGYISKTMVKGVVSVQGLR